MWIQVLALSLTSSGILGKSQNHTEPQSCIQRMGLLTAHLIRLPYVSSYFVKLSAQLLACSRCSVNED